MEEECLKEQMALYTKDYLKIIRQMGMELRHDKTKQSIWETGKIMKCMDMVY